MSSSAFGKRKLTRDDDDDVREYAPAKQLKLSTGNTQQQPDDSAMTDAQNVIPFPSFPSYTRGSSSSLTISTNISPTYSTASLPSTTISYPTFDLYPELETPMDVDQDAPSPFPHHHQPTVSNVSLESRPVGLLQPSNSSFRHTGNCTQIPRLRMSSHVGLYGTRTLWSHCEQCGAIEMVST